MAHSDIESGTAGIPLYIIVIMLTPALLKYDHIAAPGSFEKISKFIYNDAVPVRECSLHFVITEKIFEILPETGIMNMGEFSGKGGVWMEFEIDISSPLIWTAPSTICRVSPGRPTTRFIS